MKLLVYLLTVIFVVGCSLPKFSEKSYLLELAVRAASARFIDEHKTWVDEVYAITKDAIKLIESDVNIDLKELDKFVISSIPWEKLTPEEQAIINLLLGEVKLAIEEKLKLDGFTTPEDVKIVVVEVLTWVNQTVKLYK